MLDDNFSAYDLRDIVNKLHDPEKIKIFLFEYFYQLKIYGGNEAFEAGKRTFTLIILTHTNQNELKKIWLPLPLGEEFIIYVRKKLINDLLLD